MIVNAKNDSPSPDPRGVNGDLKEEGPDDQARHNLHIKTAQREKHGTYLQR